MQSPATLPQSPNQLITELLNRNMTQSNLSFINLPNTNGANVVGVSAAATALQLLLKCCVMKSVGWSWVLRDMELLLQCCMMFTCCWSVAWCGVAAGVLQMWSYNWSAASCGVHNAVAIAKLLNVKYCREGRLKRWSCYRSVARGIVQQWSCYSSVAWGGVQQWSCYSSVIWGGVQQWSCYSSVAWGRVVLYCDVIDLVSKLFQIRFHFYELFLSGQHSAQHIKLW